MQKRSTIPKRDINGVVLLNKPYGISSNTAVQKVKKLLQAKKAGHTGALDPLATGVLPVCLGEATKLSFYGLESDKCYNTCISLGVQTTTGDIEGEVLCTAAVPPLSLDNVHAVLQQFVGESMQIPPMYSALKRDGKPLYELARQGVEVEREARRIGVHQIELLSIEDAAIELSVTVSKGTYIRVLGEDIAKALGTVGHLSRLERSKTLHFDISQTIDIEALEAMTYEERLAGLLPVDVMVPYLAKIQLDADQAGYFMQGRAIPLVDLPSSTEVMVYDHHDKVLGLAIVNGTLLQPKRVMNMP